MGSSYLPTVGRGGRVSAALKGTLTKWFLLLYVKIESALENWAIPYYPDVSTTLLLAQAKQFEMRRNLLTMTKNEKRWLLGKLYCFYRHAVGEKNDGRIAPLLQLMTIERFWILLKADEIFTGITAIKRIRRGIIRWICF